MEAPQKRVKLCENNNEDGRKTTWRIFPPPGGKTRCFGVGAEVFFRPKSAKEEGRRGTIVDPIPPEVKDHVWVEFNESRTANRQKKYVSCKRLIPVFASLQNNNNYQEPENEAQQQQQQQQQEQPKCCVSIVLTPETIPYRHLACSQICDTDDVLEVGCSTGEASIILHRYCRSWVGFDSSNDMIESCSSRMASSASKQQNRELWHACKIDALSDPKRAIEAAKKFSPKGPTAVFLDIGGNREEKGVIEMMTWVLESFSDLRVLVVKSREVVNNITNMSIGASPTTYTVDKTDGILQNGPAWFRDKMKELEGSNLPRHSLQAPLVCSPLDATTPICRYYNYDPLGCKRGSNCQYDHEHCHLCLQKGHRATECNPAREGKNG